MRHTFALQQEEIVKTAAPIDKLKVKWPTLFYEVQVSKNLKKAL